MRRTVAPQAAHFDNYQNTAFCALQASRSECTKYVWIMGVIEMDGERIPARVQLRAAIVM